MDTPPEPIRVLIADNQALFRRALAALLESNGFVVVAAVADAGEAVSLARKLKPDIQLLNLSMAGVSGLDALRELEASASPVRTLLITEHLPMTEIVKALQLGARGVIRRDSPTDELVKSIRAVMAGEYWIPRECVAALVERLREVRIPPPQNSFGLTRRELEVIAAVVAGLSNKGIARMFSVSEDTVKHHLTHIFDKTGTSSRLELALFAVHHNVV
jgi:DNA-binding NarL/FixJ family response regulator